MLDCQQADLPSQGCIPAWLSILGGFMEHECIICHVKFEGKEGRVCCSMQCVGKARNLKHPQPYGINSQSYKHGLCCIGNPDKEIIHKIRSKVQVALENGSLKKQPCAICGSMDTEAHHHDYKKPLNVRWLCRKHHTDWHHHNHSPLKQFSETCQVK